jgi:hypothetical protein
LEREAVALEVGVGGAEGSVALALEVTDRVGRAVIEALGLAVEDEVADEVGVQETLPLSVGGRVGGPVARELLVTEGEGE